MKDAHSVIKNVRLTEKATGLSGKHNQYVFVVDIKATKQEIRSAVQSIFNKKVERVNTLRVIGKKKRERTASFGRKPNFKKAIVTLKEGESIDLA
jgi:large subunit ribosomal protein L23